MADLISQYEQLKQEKTNIDEKIEELEANDAFKEDMKCKDDIVTLLSKHGKTSQDLLHLFPEITPSMSKTKPARPRKSSGKQRPLIRYTHQKTGEQVESRGLNHKTLQAWIKENDKETVKSWGKEIDDPAASSDLSATEKKAKDTSKS